ncbi:hypothetical protein QFC21_001872 [Naganishia friedmannii]|uniref:Uncharacterized protein n=1 Tax=Naganishia friedmannii TaxID=89922 RepID=A0ACC2W2A6_9TREE|nr:hypothetical protein QFC21_001872 [Naganishia friedmannii]
MQMLGATPRCAACGKLAYHAEQVMGPGRKIYHKPCLQCVNCKKRLDPGALVEHDTDPYCKRCHGLLFGTRERSENVDPAREDDSAQVGIDGSRSTEKHWLQETQATEPRHPETPPTSNSAALDFPHTEKRFTSIDDAINSATTTTDHLPKLSLDATPQPKLSHPEASTTTNIRGPVIHASSPRKNPLLMSSPYRSKPIMPARSSPSGNEQCAGCEKTVYFAEGVSQCNREEMA